MVKDFVSAVSQATLLGRGPAQSKQSGQTYPAERATSTSNPLAAFLNSHHVQARYKMFDLSKPSEVEELQEITEKFIAQEAIQREERWSHDKDGLTVVTMSWLEITPKKQKKKFGPEFYRDGEDPEDEDMDGTDEVAHVTKPEDSM